LPLHATAVGKVLLAYEEVWVREGYVRGHLEATTSRTHVNRARLLAELATVRRLGYATTLEEARSGSCSIAVPVKAEPGGAALGLVMLSTEAPHLTRHVPVLQGVARRIDAAIARPPIAANWPSAGRA
jgi:DNA-binding IclR family transcriptional regulator